MDAPGSSPREQGMQALREGNLDKAIEFLGRAVMADDHDADAKALLGIAYSQKGLHAQAKRALQTAVELQPQNPNFRFNLGVALEKGGDLQGAALTYRDTLGIKPDHEQARAKLQAMGPQAHAFLANAGRAPASATPSSPGAPSSPPGYAPPPPAPAAAPPPGMPPIGAPGMGGPPPLGGPPLGGPAVPNPPAGGPPSSGPPPLGGPPLGGPPLGGGPLGAPTSGPPPIAPPGMGGGGLVGSGGPPGTVQCSRCHQHSKPGMSCEWCGAPLAAGGARGGQTAPAANPYASPVSPYGSGSPSSPPVYGGSATVEEEFNLVNGFRAWFQLLISPNAFFEEQRGYDGIKGAMAFLLAYSLAASIISTLARAASGMYAGPLMLPQVAGGLACGGICGWLAVMLVMFIWAGIVHLCARMFGGQGNYSASFRAAAYANAPAFALALISSAVMPFLMPKSLMTAPRTRGSVSAPAITAPRQLAAARLATVPALQTPPGFPGGSSGFPSGRPGMPGGSSFPGGTPGFPGSPGSSAGSPSAAFGTMMSQMMTYLVPILVLYAIGWIWSTVILAIGIRQLHDVSAPSGAFAAIAANFVSIGIVVLIWLAFAGMLVAIFAAAASRASGR